MISNQKKVSLAGEWAFALDENNKGIKEKWFNRKLDDIIQLPGTTDEAKKGEFADERCEERLSRIWRWIGPAWYQKTVTIPKRWKDKRISLYLERTKDSQVWVDGNWAGGDDSLSTPHEYDLTNFLTPGKHSLTILIDNAKLPPVGPSHQVDERTQTNWNGIVGRIELIATDKLWIDDIQVYPHQEWVMIPGTEETEDQRALLIKGIIGNAVKLKGEAKISVNIESEEKAKAVRVPSRRFKIQLSGEKKIPIDLKVPIPLDLPVWDEFDRTMLQITMSLSFKKSKESYSDKHSVLYGMRNFATARGQFVVNGRPTFLRGKNDCALFPITGYAPMDKAFWIHHLGIAAEYGINHYRFHSWCPPEAAFEAADELGIYFQVELPNKRGITTPDNHDYTPPAEAYETLDELVGDAGDPAVRTAYLTREGERILKTYGNHPCFVMMTLGNEIGGDESVMENMCNHFRSLDNRHLYAMGTNHFHWEPRYRKGDDFWVIKGTAIGKHIRGASWEFDLHIDAKPPSTTVDYEAHLRGVPVPVVGHEMAQFEVFPDFNEIKKYTGVLKARYLEIFRQRLEDAGMLDQAMDFLKASGAISTICHREDVEAALRTPNFGGFQMLDLQDFNGQGVALIGLLDVFMESKGLIKPEKWRQFCCETVPLLWMTKYTWTTDEIFSGRIRVAHYGPRDLQQQTLTWRLMNGRKKVASGETIPVDIPTGTLTEVDVFFADLAKVKAPRKLALEIKIPSTDYRNSYDIWVYPAKVNTKPSANFAVSRKLTNKVRGALKSGERVLLMPKSADIKKSVRMAFQSGFWSPMFRNRPGRLNPLGKETPGTQGILCDPEHPFFKNFPTEFHTNWQWWQLVKNSRAMILDDLPAGFRPLVQVIDGFDRNHKLGLIFEANVGKGKLIVCSIDLPNLQGYPEGRQLLASLQMYMDSTDFKPAVQVDIKQIKPFVG